MSLISHVEGKDLSAVLCQNLELAGHGLQEACAGALLDTEN